MNSKVLLLFLFMQMNLFAQDSTETVVIRKTTHNLYRGVLAETKSWYLLIDTEGNYYLATIEKPEEEIYDWFVRFKNSQNIYKANPSKNSPLGSSGAQFNTLHFTKENDPGDIMNFYIERPEKGTIVLISFEGNNIFTFQQVIN